MTELKLPFATLVAALVVAGFATPGAAAGGSGTGLQISSSTEFSARAGGRVRNVGARRPNVNRPARHPNVNVHTRPNIVIHRPIRVWAPRPYYGRVVAGVALGTVITAAAIGTVPRPPASNLCWFWSDPAMISGYWDYCR